MNGWCISGISSQYHSCMYVYNIFICVCVCECVLEGSVDDRIMIPPQSPRGGCYVRNVMYIHHVMDMIFCH